MRCRNIVDLCDVERGKQVADFLSRELVSIGELSRSGYTVLSDPDHYIQSQDWYIALVRHFCEVESCKDSNQLMMRYHEKMSELVHYSLISPSCIIPSRHQQKLSKYWIDPEAIMLHHGFGFYHHSPSEIIQHAYEKRADYEYLVGEMGELASGGLNLAEYPSPLPGHSLYMVKGNGNHRSLLFRLLNLPCVMSVVERNTTACWLYAHSDYALVYPYLLLLANCDMIKDLRGTRFGYEFVLAKSGLGIWLLPGSYVESRSALIADVRKRIRLIERTYSSKGVVIPKIFHSRLLWLRISKVSMVRECARLFEEWLVDKSDANLETRPLCILKRILRY